MTAYVAAPIASAATLQANDGNTVTPIKHVIVIVGENRTFDHLFATYVPKSGQTVSNLLSKGIITADGEPGPRFNKAAQWQASDTKTYSNAPQRLSRYDPLPPPSTGYTAQTATATAPPFTSLSIAAQMDYGLLPGDLGLLLTGASGLPQLTVDTRIANANDLPSGPYQLTPGQPYDAYANSPVHRFYQMWQQTDCSVAHAHPHDPSGCRNDLFAWVEASVGPGSNGKAPPVDSSTTPPGEGATGLGFYNVQKGDMPFFKSLADEYAIADNYHQPVMGGTGANSIMTGTADALYFTDGQGNAATPPTNEIENPDPQPGTNNYYTQDGYSGGSYSECADATAPGVAAVVTYLGTLPYKPNPNCDPGHYYLLNNYDPGYYGNGTVATPTDTFSIPPSPVPTIADRLLAGQVSWRYYGEGFAQYLDDPKNPANVYCNICNPFQYETAVMANEAVRTEHLKDTTDFYNDVRDGTLPAVSYIKPSGLNDGHPESSKFSLFEAFTRKVLVELAANKKLAASTAVMITVDEGGGYYDSGYIQPLDFFGDGTRIPLIVVSPYSRGGNVVHTYYDHVSILKFIEKNWSLPPISDRSRDNLPNPSVGSDPYVPTNSPAIGDLMDMFTF